MRTDGERTTDVRPGIIQHSSKSGPDKQENLGEALGAMGPVVSSLPLNCRANVSRSRLSPGHWPLQQGGMKSGGIFINNDSALGGLNMPGLQAYHRLGRAVSSVDEGHLFSEATALHPALNATLSAPSHTHNR